MITFNLCNAFPKSQPGDIHEPRVEYPRHQLKTKGTMDHHTTESGFAAPAVESLPNIEQIAPPSLTRPKSISKVKPSLIPKR